MIIFETFIFLILTLFSIYTFAGLGQLVLKQNEKFLFESIFFGFIVASFIITLLHFFIKINFYIIFLVFLSGFLCSVKKIELSNFDFKKNYIYFVIFFVFVPIYLSQKYHEDFGFYHLPYVINLSNEKIIFGMANVNSAFIYNSIWLNLMALFNFKDNFNFLTLPSFLLYVFFALFALKNTFNQQKYKGSQYFLIVCLFYLIFGLFFLRKTLLLFFSEFIASIVLVVLVVGTNLLYYSSSEPCMSHAYSFSLISIFIFSP